MNFLLIGRPNIGKSSIYNILTTGEKNIIHDEEGTTRDWHKNNVIKYNNIFIYDTPGVIIQNNKINKFDFSKLFDLVDKFIYVIDYRLKNFETDLQSLNVLRVFNKQIFVFYCIYFIKYYNY